MTKSKPQYQIRKIDGKWWSGDDWTDGVEAATFTELPDMLPVRPASWMHQQFAQREGKAWFYEGKKVIIAVYIGEN